MKKPFVLGITGPVHSGKSTAARILAKHGYRVFDADQDVWRLYQNPSVLSKIQLILGEEAVLDGRLNKGFVAKALSESEHSKKALEAFLYPLVKKDAEEAIASLHEGEKLVLDVPLLFPSKMDSLCDETILIESAASFRAERLLREGKDVQGQMSLNDGYPIEEAREKADASIRNEGTEADLEAGLLAILS